METQSMTDFLSYKIGDTVELDNEYGQFKIKDIRVIRYLANPRVEFQFQILLAAPFDDIWLSISEIKRRIE